MKKNMFAIFITIVCAMVFGACANCTYSEELGACVEDIPEEKTDDAKTDIDDAKTDDEKSDTDIVDEPEEGSEGGACFKNGTCMDNLSCVEVNGKDICVDLTTDDDSVSDEEADETTDEDTVEAGDEGEKCLPENKCNDDLVCHEATQTCVQPETGKEGEGCFPNQTCMDGLVCDQASENDTDTCKKVVGTIGEKNGSCKADRTCNTGLVCFRADFICLDMPTVGSASFCWDRELNTDPVVSYCGSIGGYAPMVWQDVSGTATPKCEGVNDYPQPECVRVDTSKVSLETFRNSTSAQRDGYALTGSFYLPVRK